MTCAVCPRCGTDLQPLDAFSVGRLFVDKAGSHIWWRDRPLKLTCAQRLIVAALARADGQPIRKHVLAEIIGHDGEHPEWTINTLVCRTKQVFRAADPQFAMIENVRGLGLRWKIEEAAI